MSVCAVREHKYIYIYIAADVTYDNRNLHVRINYYGFVNTIIDVLFLNIIIYMSCNILFNRFIMDLHFASCFTYLNTDLVFVTCHLPTCPGNIYIYNNDNIAKIAIIILYIYIYVCMYIYIYIYIYILEQLLFKKSKTSFNVILF